MTEEYQGKHEADLPPDSAVTPDGVNHELTVAADEESGTPPHVSAQVRSSVYVGCLIVNVIAIMLAGLLPLFGVITYEKAAAAGGVILVAINTVSAALAVGYRPTRPGSPVKPIE